MDLQAQGAAGLLHDLDGKVSPKALAAVNAAVGWADPVRGLPFVASNYDVGKLEADEKAQVAALTGRYGDPTVLSGTDQSVPGHPSRGSDYTQYGQLYVKEPIAGDFRKSIYSNADDWFQKKTLLQLERANPHGATIVDPLDSVHPTPRLQPARAGSLLEREFLLYLCRQKRRRRQGDRRPQPRADPRARAGAREPAGLGVALSHGQARERRGRRVR